MRSAKDSASRGIFGDMASLVSHLPRYQEDATLVLLKGHLLVEELLRGYVDRKLPNPAAFKYAQFQFASVLTLCRALTSPRVKTWVFGAAKKLNEARNVVAHELDSPEFSGKLEAFVVLVEQHQSGSVFPSQERGEARLHMAIIDLHNELIDVLRVKE